MLGKRKRLWALFLSAALIVTQLPAVALGGGGTFGLNNTEEQAGIKIVANGGGEVVYTEGSGFMLKSSGAYEISGTWSGSLTNAAWTNLKAVITVPAGVNADVTLSNVTITNISGTNYACAFAVEAGGTAIITLAGTNTLTSGGYRAGLEVPDNAKVTIAGDGILKANGGNCGAGIGGSDGDDGGSITINSGTVTANGGGHSAGIGGGDGGDGGSITINGGTITANGGSDGAGIGGSGNVNLVSGSSGGSITINNGTVIANGGSGGAGIGGGGGNGDGGIIVINNGTVTANGGDYSAGIGGSRHGGDGGSITINSGAVTANGGNHGAGIGSGYGGISISNGGIIEIKGGTVEANGSAGGAGIGGGASPSGNDTAGVITINGNTTVFAKGGGTGANAIGSGEGSSDTTAPTLTQGVVFEDEIGTVYGSPELTGCLNIPGGSTLTIPNGTAVTLNGEIANNGTIENYGAVDGSGIITNNGIVNDYNGGINVKVNGTGAVNKPSEVKITFWNSQSGQIIQASYGDTITVQAEITRKNTRLSTAAPDQVIFRTGSTELGTASVTNGTAALTLTLTGNGWTPGSYTITADYGGGAGLVPNSTGTANLTVEKRSPKLSLKAAPADSRTLPGDVALTAVLSGIYPDQSGKTITFTVNGTSHQVTADNFGVAVYTMTNPPPGTYDLGAFYAEDSLNKRAEAAEIKSYTVSLGTQAALTLNGLGKAYTYGCEPFHLSTSGGSGSGAVSYISSDSSVASVTGSAVTILKAGKFTITAIKAADSSYAEATAISPEVTVIETTPDVSLTAAGGSTTSEALILTATVSTTGAGATPAGTVTFKKENTPLETVTLDGTGKASHTISIPAAGSYKYTAEYSGQTGYYTGASATRTIGVGLADQTGFAITDPGAKAYGDSDFTLTATGGQGTGRVSFSAPQNNGVLTVAADGAAKITGAGKVTVTAAKDADSTYKQATATLELTVAPRDIDNVTVNVTGNRVYTGSQLQPVFEVKDGALAITTGDYTNSYGSNLDAGTGAGSITLAGQHNYTGTKTVSFEIEKRPLDSAAVALESTSYTHTGSEIRPAVTKVVVDGITVPAAEYDVGYTNNINEGNATVTVKAKADSSFIGSASATFAITKSNNPSNNNSSAGASLPGGSPEPESQNSYTSAGGNISQTVSFSDLKKLADSGKSLTLRCDKAGMTFNPAALSAILAEVPATAADVIFAAAPADPRAFPDAAEQIGSHPVYEFTISCKDSNGNSVKVPVNFPAGSASVSLNYVPSDAEVAGSLFMVYVDGRGGVTWLDKSVFSSGRMLSETPHFSVYGVAYKTPAPVFKDTANHWAKTDIEFAAARGLLTGSVNKLFSPYNTIRRGMLAAALGRLAGIDPDSFRTRSFTDIKDGAYYAAYAEWAAQNNIVKGTGDKLFGPDAPLTREQLAVIMVKYAAYMGYSIPAPPEAATFADSGKISSWAQKEVAALQRAGIIRSSDGNRFRPQRYVTRGEAAAMLRLFVEVVIAPSTAGREENNASGH